MATELGKAYVQIMPSAKGISGSITKTLEPEATAAGKRAGRSIASSIANSLGKAGSTLTKAITVPALGAATAISGMVGALGWGRLTGLDAARAKLQGLGYDMQSVERISGQVRDAIQGTVTTMAEGTSVAAGALAAGVKEGAELERYIKLVGDAAVGANRPVADMAQIFNRVQGAGKLMTQELNMIEDGMPGFAMAMSKSLGVSQEEFRKMVTAGEVSSEQFLDVMEDFAGEMSDAYANSWAGMVSNTKANIGIIGENILGGVFEQSKEAIAEFLEFLRSDDLRTWAKETGKIVGQAFNNLITSVKELINWWIDLDSETKGLILKLIGAAVAIGPILVVLGKLINAGKIVSGVIAAIASPVGLVVTAVIGLIAVFATLYKNNEKFRDLVQNVWEKIKETVTTVVQVISDVVQQIWGALTEWWSDNGEAILQKASEVWNFIYDTISTVISNVVEFVKEIWGTLTEFWHEHGEMYIEAVKNVWGFIFDVIKKSVEGVWKVIEFIWPTIQAIIENVWEAIKRIIQGAVDVILGIIQFFSALFTGNWGEVWESVKRIVDGALDIIMGIIRGVFGSMNDFISSILNTIKDTITNIFNSFKNIVKNAFNNVKDAVKNGMDSAFNTVKGFFGKFKDAGKNIVNSIADGIKGAVSKVTDAISNVTSKIRDFLPFSPAKVGPLKDLDKLDFGGTISLGIDDGTDEVQRAMDSMLSIPMKATPYNGGLGMGSNAEVTGLLTELINATRENRDLIIDGHKVAKAIGDPMSVEGGKRIRRIERGLA